MMEILVYNENKEITDIKDIEGGNNFLGKVKNI